MSIDGLQGRLRDFASDRDWEQFHTPKNLVMALVGEGGEGGDLSVAEPRRVSGRHGRQVARGVSPR